MSDKPHYPLSTHRHSLAHLLAQAVQRTTDANAKLGIGPAIEHGFYYDFIFSDGVEFGEKNLKELTKTMQQIIKENQTFVEYESSFDEAREFLTMIGQGFKVDLLDKFAEEWDTRVTYWLNIIPTSQAEHVLRSASEDFKVKYDMITAYLHEKFAAQGKNDLTDQYVMFVDLCEWPHVATTKDIVPNAFALDKLAGAYWRGDENNPMMTRIYGLAFDNKDDLKAYQTMMEEARKRDHRKLGKELKLFTTSELVGAGLPLLQPKGAILRGEVEKYLWELHSTRGYDRVWTPHLAKEALYECSGHAGHYMDDMFKVKGWSSGEDFYVKPMNCPHHMQLFADNQWSYRDMPVRYFEPWTVYRDEKSGQLSGLARVRSITQDDGHLFCRVSQIKQEVGTIVDIIKEFYNTMGMLDHYRVSLSVRDPQNPDKYLGGEDIRNTAENALEEIAKEEKLNYKKIEWEAAFYGPKLDFMFKDAIGRERQLATVQLDFNLPKRFDLSYTNEEGEKERPVVVHRAISGSLERFMALMIEHFAGAFPVWLAPVQVIVLPVADKFDDYARETIAAFQAQGIRIDLDTSGDSLPKMVRNAEKQKIPYILIVGEKEVTDGTVSVREYKTKDQYEVARESFVEKIVRERDERVL